MPDWPVLEVAIRHRIGRIVLDVQFQASQPWTVLFAPSGAGKTSLLRLIAGLDLPDHGLIAWAGTHTTQAPNQGRRVLTDTVQNRFIPAHARHLPMVTQDAALFPHLTVDRNIAYGFRQRDAAERARELNVLMKLCRLEHLSGKFPGQLSGGEQQRVALARALGAGGSALLLDEPFAGLDGALKDELMRDVKAWLKPRSVPVLHVTHDVGEVFAVADEVIRLNQGRVVGQGSPHAVLEEEQKRLLGWLTL